MKSACGLSRIKPVAPIEGHDCQRHTDTNWPTNSETFPVSLAACTTPIFPSQRGNEFAPFIEPPLQELSRQEASLYHYREWELMDAL
jgi:hypothetical protein